MTGWPRCRRHLQASLLAASALAGGGARAEELKFDLSGKIQTDLRFRLQDESVGNYYDQAKLAAGLERNQNLVSVKMKAQYGKFYGVAAADMYLNAVGNKLQAFGSLQQYSAVQPFSFEPQQAYVQGRDLFFKGFDLTVGNQIINWGVGDQFNPTNNLNADDVRDPLLFGKQQPNFMVKADYWINRAFSLSAVLVPVFKPALLPASAALGAVDIQRQPFVDDFIRHRIEGEAGFAANGAFYPTVVHSLTPVLPQTSADNMQFAFRIAGAIAEQDIALSYYLGRTDFPQPFANHTHQYNQVRCDPGAPTSCIMGTLGVDTLLTYPRMHVYGLNASGEFNPFKKISESIHGIGYRVEAALVVPQQTSLQLTQDALPGVLQPAGEYDYQSNGVRGGTPPLVVENTPFAKWTVGLDYTFGAHVYLNVMWVHGLVDEYGAGDYFHQGWQVRQSSVSSTLTGGQVFSQCVIPKDGTTCATETLLPKLGDYFVLGADFKFLDDAALFRLFTIWDLSGVWFSSYDPTAMDPTTHMMGTRVTTHSSELTKEGFSAVIYPELDYNFGNGLELGGGALVLLGRSYTKFGDPAAGGSVLFTRGRFSF